MSLHVLAWTGAPTHRSAVIRRTLDARRLSATTSTRARLAVSRGAATAGASSPDPIVILPGFLQGSKLYAGMRDALAETGYSASVVDIKVWDWIPALFGGSFEFYLKKLQEEVDRVLELHDGVQVQLVAHSAGGWLARIYLGSEVYNGKVYAGEKKVTTLLCLGTPHQSLEAYPFGRVEEIRHGEDDSLPADVQGSSLRFANHHYPGAFLPTVKYITICGKSVEGREKGGTSEASFAFGSYTANCGRGSVWGDGVTPLESAILEGATVEELDGVRHLPASGVLWYGDREVVEQWRSLLDF